MEGSLTKAKVNLKDGLIELEGSENFVSEQLKLYAGIFSKLAESFQVEEASSVTSVPNRQKEGSVTPPEDSDNKCFSHFGVSSNELSKVIHLEEDSFTIITTKIKGPKADMQVKYCLLYCLAKEYYGEKSVNTKDLRDVCQYFDCFDSGNFAGNLAEKKSYFIIEGKSGSSNKQVKLTSPGKEEARNIIASILKGE